MSHIVAQPGRNAARQAKKLKEIRKVKGAIVWHERERTKRQKLFQERWESKQAVIQRLKWENENVKKVRKTALDNAREDWQLGSLRPNRAIGVSAEKYGARTGEQMQKPDIPVHTQKNRNETRVKRGLEPEYPLVVDDTKWFPFRTDDRVVVVNGREKGKIGVVQDIVSRTHEIIVKGVNMVGPNPPVSLLSMANAT
jgi:large subunit ribosomal protein L24